MLKKAYVHEPESRWLNRVLCLALAFALIPSWAFGVNAEPADPDSFITDGRTANYRFNGAGEDPAADADNYDSPLVVRKTVKQLTGEGFDERDFELTLTATGYDWEEVKEKDVNVVFVIDTTSSMTNNDIPSGAGSGNVRRMDATLEAAKAYIGALYEADAERKINTAIASFGKSARVHFAPGDFGDIREKMDVGVNKANSFNNTGEYDHFIGNYITGNYYEAGKGNDSATTYEKAKDIFKQFKAAFGNGNSDELFYNKQDTLLDIVDNISKYSDTNVESGLLMADFLLENKTGSNNAVNIVMLITDGESNSSSSLSMLENHPLLIEAFDDFDNYDAIMKETARLAASEDFVSKLFSDIDEPGEINFFTGVYHNLDRIEIDTQGSGAQYDMIPDKAMGFADKERLRQYARHVFWLAETRTGYYKSDDYANIIQGEDIFDGYYSGNVFGRLKEYFFDSGQLTKDSRTLLVDYQEICGEPKNASGSDGAKYFLQRAAERLGGYGDTHVYVTGVGSRILEPEKLKEAASSPDTFFFCADASSATIKNAEALKTQFVTLGRTAALEGIQDLTITDRIPRRAEGVAAVDDDTFTVKEPYPQTVKARFWYYGPDGNPTQTEWQPYDDGSAKWEINLSAQGESLVSFNFGTMYSEHVSELSRSAEYPYKAELRIRIRANDGVVSGNSGGLPDIDTNISAEATWTDKGGGREEPYPIPKVYFTPGDGGDSLLGKLILTKRVEDTVTDDSFTFDVWFSEPVTYGEQSGQDFTVALAHEEVATFTDIPLGASYTVTEDPTEGYASNHEDNMAKGTVGSEGESVEVEFVNTFSPPYQPEPYSFNLQKIVTGDPVTSEDFLFDVWFSEPVAYGAENGREFTVSLAHGEVATFTDISLGASGDPEEIEYTVTEVEIPDNYTTSHNGGETDSDYIASGRITGEDIEDGITVIFTNRYDNPEPEETPPPATPPASTPDDDDDDDDSPPPDRDSPPTQPTQPPQNTPPGDSDNPNDDDDFTPIGDMPVPLAELPNLTTIFDDGVPLAKLPTSGGARGTKYTITGLLAIALGFLLLKKKGAD